MLHQRVAQRAGVRTAILAGGLLGSSGRIGLEALWTPAADELPWATLTVNLLGAFLLGLLVPWLLRDGHPLSRLAPLLATGLLGSLTTFSLLLVEVWERAADGHVELAASYLAITLVGGLVAAFAGLRIGRRLP